MKKLLLLCSLLCLAIFGIYGQKQPNAMVHDEISNGYMPERLMDKDSLFMRRRIQGSMMSGKMTADRADLPGRHNMEAEQRLTAVKKVDTNSTKGDVTFVEQSDSLALVALYNSTNGPGWSSSTGWLTGPVSTWYGVEVFSSKVHSVDLSNNRLSGAIPPEIGNLTSLQSLDLFNNQLSGAIPPEIGSLTSLQILYLANNQLSGAIPPEIGSLTSLQDLDLGSNQLSGAIPPEMGSLTSLQFLDLSYNRLSGAIPPEMGSLTSLENLYLSSNQLSGAIPPEMGSLTSLRYLNLGYNQLSGAIPPEIGNLTNLLELFLRYNWLSGAIPPEIGNLTSLQYLYLYNNQLSGAIPQEIGSLTSLENLYLNSNGLSGAIPHEIGSLTSLRYLNLNDNQLSGAIPPEIGNLTSLLGLYLDDNKLSGAIPPEMGSLTSLEYLYLHSNLLSDLPDLSASPSLLELNASNNHLTFEDIEPNLSGSFNFYYSPQARVGSEQHYTPSNGDNLDISVSVGGTHNTYQWLKDGADIPGATGATYSISSYSRVEHAGVYVCRIQNSMATGLTLESYSIYVGVDVPTYTVDVSASPASSGTVSGGGTYEDGQTVTVSATPNTGYQFVSWTSNGTEVSTSPTYTFVVTSDTSLVANFELNTYTVSATPSPTGSGTVTGAGTYSHGASVSLVATPNTGYRFVSWTSNGTEVSTNSTYTFVVTSDTSLVANFENITGIIEDGLKESISIYPNPTNRLITVSGEGADVKSVAVYDFMGRQIGHYNVNTAKATFDFTGYPSGIYLVVVQTNRGIFTRKIVRE